MMKMQSKKLLLTCLFTLLVVASGYGQQSGVGSTESSGFSVRTNLLYDAFLVPTFGVEWRANDHVGVKLDGSFSYWGSETSNIQKMWFISPEIRWYMDSPKQFYLGIGANVGEYNSYGYLLGGFYPDQTGYQGDLWSAGITAGYQLDLSSCLMLDFNLGLGYTRSNYDSFAVIDGARVCKAKKQHNDFWGPTQAGVSLVWKLGRKK